MNEIFRNYELEKLIYCIIFGEYKNRYNECDYLFEESVINMLKSIVGFHVRTFSLSKESRENVYDYLSHFREINKDINILNIINEIKIILNSQQRDMSDIYYYYEDCKREGCKLKFSEVDAKNVEESMIFDFFVLTSHDEECTDDELFFKNLYVFADNVLYYKSINAILAENPVVFKNQTFYNRVMCVFEATYKLRNNRYVKKLNKKLIKEIQDKIKSV